MRFILILSTFITSITFAQDLNIDWQNTIGGNSEDFSFSIIQTTDNGYFIGGTSSSNSSGDKTEDSQGLSDYWVIKLDNSGTIEWQNTIGGNNDDFLYSVKQTLDGGYILGGLSYSNANGDKTENSIGGGDYWVLKLSSSGNIQWQNTIGGTDDDVLDSIIATNDGGYFLSGYSASNISGDKSEDAIGSADYWVVKLNNIGNVVWDNTIGGTDLDLSSISIQSEDGGFFIGGISFSGISGDKTEDSHGGKDYWVLKLNDSGTIEWQNTIGGNNDDILNSIYQCSDNGFILGGHSNSEISGDKTENSIGDTDYWIVKLNSSGIIEWENTIGGTLKDEAWSISQTFDNGYIIGGESNSNISGDKTEDSNGEIDFWIVKLNSQGILTEQNTIGGDNNDKLRSLINTNSFIIAGSSNSNISGDKTENTQGGNDYWILKLGESLGVSENDFLNTITIYPNPVQDELQINSTNLDIDLIKIYNHLGQLLLSKKVNSDSPSINVSNLASGEYFIQFHSGKEIALKKFIKQ